MSKHRVQGHSLIAGIRRRVVIGATSLGAAVIAIALALIAMTALILAFGTIGVAGVNPAPHGFSSALEDAGASFYLAQLVGLWFFDHTAELRFVAVPVLLLIGLSIMATTAIAARLTPGPARRKLTVALATPFAYALVSGLAAQLVPLHLTAHGFGDGIVVSPPPVEAFLLPLVWGLLFASVGGLIGAFGKDWRREGMQLLGVWTTPLISALRALAVALVTCAAVTVASVLTLTGGMPETITSRGLGHGLLTIGAAVLALPTLVAAVFVSGFGVSFDWNVNALSEGHGSISALGGTVPTSNSGLAHAHGAPAVLALAPVLVLVTVLAVGWLSARRSSPSIKLCLVNALRAAALLTLATWLLGMLARVDAQAGGLLGFHMAPNSSALLWQVPLISFAGCFAGTLAFLLSRGRIARRRLGLALRGVAQPSAWSLALNGPATVRQSLAWRAALGAGFVAVPLLVVGLGPAGAAPPSEPAPVSVVPIEREAEQTFEEDSAQGSEVEVTASPETRAINTASVETPLHELGIAPDEPKAVKAKQVLDQYGEMFGVDDPKAELGEAETVTDKLGSHTYFTQMADGLPVYGTKIGVHVSRDGKTLNAVMGSLIPDVTVSGDAAQVSSDEAIEVAKKELPHGELAQPATLQVFAGSAPYFSGPNARKAWFVWLIDNGKRESTEYVVDASTGRILDVISKESFALNRTVYTAGETKKLPGTLARKEGEPPTADSNVNEAYDYSTNVYDYYRAHFEERKSYDAQDAPLKSTVHFAEKVGVPYENSYWNGEEAVFGNNYTKALDMVGHEFTHGLTEHTSGLVMSGQPGSLNEAFSDIIGTAIEAEKLEGEEKAINWEMGKELPGGAVRSLSEPKKFQELLGSGDSHTDPEKLSEWDATCADNLGVHINSTITSHAFYLIAKEWIATGGTIHEVAEVFYRAFALYLSPNSTLEDARAAVLKVMVELYGEGSPEYEIVKTAFNTVGLNGTAQPTLKNCPASNPCSFGRALKTQARTEGSESAVEMLETLYRARGELAQNSVSGKYFLPLYEGHMGRITELVSQDTALAEEAVTGLEELTPALDALIEGKGEEFELSPKLMARIEAALRRLAEDDRLYAGEDAGELADLIEEELSWMKLHSYGGMNFKTGFQRLNNEVEANTMSTLSEEGTTVSDLNCLNSPYNNNFEFDGFYVDTPEHYIPGQASPLYAEGVACGTVVKKEGSETTCTGKETLNTTVTVNMPPGDKVNPSSNLANGSWVGWGKGSVIACAGTKSQVIPYGEGALRSLKSWAGTPCPEAAIACYEGKATYEEKTGTSYAWVTESGGKLTMTMSPIKVVVEGVTVPVGFGQVGVRLCARAGAPGTKECGGSSQPWIHQNGEYSERGCSTGKGLFTATVTNSGGSTTLPARSCVAWEREAHMQTLEGGSSLNSISCIPSTTTCVAAGAKGNALYSTNISATAGATWNTWAGPSEQSPAEAVACPSTTLCELADGSVAGGGGNVYRASSLGGSFLTSFTPTNGVNGFSCPSTSFCIATQEGEGFIRYSTKPSGATWTAVSIGTGAMKASSCLSASFCAVVDSTGNVHVAVTEKGVKEATGWKATNIDGTTPLRGIVCTSTTSCMAVDGSGQVLNLTIAGGGEASVSKQTITGASELNTITCTGSTCVAGDGKGGIFTSYNTGSSWGKRYASGDKLNSVSCISAWLCGGVNVSGDVVTFNPQESAPHQTQMIDSGNSLNAVSCISGTTECVATDSAGKALYSTNVSATGSSTWSSWSGPSGQSPSQAVACPTSTLCVIADGKEAAGGNLYYATAFGGAFTSALSPTFGVSAIACPSASLCVAGHDGNGNFSYSTSPASASWEVLKQGEAGIKSVSCLSTSFCVMADNKGRVHVATSNEKIKSSSWTETNVNSGTALTGAACTSTTSCVATDGAGNILRLTIAVGGGATVTSNRDIDNSNELTAVTCTTNSTCVAVDAVGNVFVSDSAGEFWFKHHELGKHLTAVSCSSNSLCVATDNTGQMTAFDPR
jgi:Zn-dependent metalloprotease